MNLCRSVRHAAINSCHWAPGCQTCAAKVSSVYLLLWDSAACPVYNSRAVRARLQLWVQVSASFSSHSFPPTAQCSNAAAGGDSLQLSPCPATGPWHHPRCVKGQNAPTRLLRVLPTVCHILVLPGPAGASRVQQLPFSSAIPRDFLARWQDMFHFLGRALPGLSKSCCKQALSLTAPSAFLAGRSPSSSLRLM